MEALALLNTLPILVSPRVLAFTIEDRGGWEVDTIHLYPTFYNSPATIGRTCARVINEATDCGGGFQNSKEFLASTVRFEDLSDIGLISDVLEDVATSFPSIRKLALSFRIIHDRNQIVSGILSITVSMMVLILWIVPASVYKEFFIFPSTLLITHFLLGFCRC
jgi:hypothetical protein